MAVSQSMSYLLPYKVACLERLPSMDCASTAVSESSSSRWSEVCDGSVPTPRSEKPLPSLPAAYPLDLVTRNTFLDFASDSTDVLTRRRARSLEPQRVTPAAAHDDGSSISNTGVGRVGSNVAYTAPHHAPVLQQACNDRLPSVGSLAHFSGECKPCGFFWKQTGCSRGVQCEFCHLCDFREKRQRHQAKKAMLKAQAKAAMA
eukprot:TRINITY_DN51141_c0_g2_i1.p1 TRINITY_DN51141_c0_g2~~TRINITY_DN51141_c0_g2_i1.p1  ORF type:complete len:203 (-),score=31.74 TRINITY_DN51141_c0_g2_i1:301-909(-)